MSAILCGKRSFFEELTVSSPPVTKRIRCSSSSPVRFSPPRPNVALSFSSNQTSSLLIDNLIALFPDMDKQILEKALEECGDDLDSAIRSLTELRLGSVDNNMNPNVVRPDASVEANVQQEINNAQAPPSNDPQEAILLQMDGADWVELFVREMKSAADVDDARARASRALEALEKSICARTARSYEQENRMLKEQLQAVIQENSILKRAVSIQHERQKEYEDRSQELEQLKQMAAQYQEQLRALEVSNYALAMHLKQAQQSSSMPGRFHPDVF